MRKTVAELLEQKEITPPKTSAEWEVGQKNFNPKREIKKYIMSDYKYRWFENYDATELLLKIRKHYKKEYIAELFNVPPGMIRATYVQISKKMSEKKLSQHKKKTHST